MSSRVSTIWVVLLVVAAAGVGATVGYELAPRGSGPSAALSGTLSITAAGTLGSLFPRVADQLVNETPGVSAPLAAQQYEGSLAALQAVRSNPTGYDVAASADYRLIPSTLEPDAATFEVVFATSSEVLAYDPTVPAFAGINSTNWVAELESSGTRLAVSNASVDPSGYNAIFVLELAGSVGGGSLDSVYGHFFTSPPGSLALPNPATTQVIVETQAATLLGTHSIQATILYRAYAVSHHLSFVALDPRIDLGNLSTSALALDATASTAILTANGTSTVVGGPVLYAATVPRNAPNAALGIAFLHLLLSPEGTALVAGAAFSPVFPGWADASAAVPPELEPDVVPLPSTLAE
jgi:molybdate/tungstate transport system substrate-binding protein